MTFGIMVNIGLSNGLVPCLWHQAITLIIVDLLSSGPSVMNRSEIKIKI